MLNAKREADRIFMEKQELKAQKAREEGKSLQDTYIRDMVGVTYISSCILFSALSILMMTLFMWRLKNVQGVIAREKKSRTLQWRTKLSSLRRNFSFRDMPNMWSKLQRRPEEILTPSQRLLERALVAVWALYSVGLDRVIYDESGVQMPKYVSDTTQNIKQLNETTHIHQSKKRLGFTW